MMPRRSFLCRALLGSVGLAVIPATLSLVRRPSLWITDDEPSVAFAVQLFSRHHRICNARIFASKSKAIECLQTAVEKPALIVTDYWSSEMRGDEFIRLARHASPGTKIILFSAVVGSAEEYIDCAGLNALKPDAIVEKPNVGKLIMTLAGAMRNQAASPIL